MLTTSLLTPPTPPPAPISRYIYPPRERASLMDCLKTTALNCNDAPFMLRSFGLDFQALNDTYNVLCNYTKGMSSGLCM
ncbi:hypothetical protein ElyMa_001737800, partial [Elysia marginata]